MKRRAFHTLLAATALLGAAHQAMAAGPLKVVATFSILGDVVRELAGNRAIVTTLVGNDQDMHAYQARPADVRAIREADLVLMNGLGFEGASLQRAVRDSKVRSLEVGRGIPLIEMGDDHAGKGSGEGHDHGKVDPHVWGSPANMHRYAQNIAGALIIADPAGRLYYGQRLLDYQQTLRELDTWAEQEFNTVPLARRKVLTGHDAFGYLGKRYKIDFVAPLGLSTEGDASARTVARLVQQVRQENIKAVFIENIKDPRLLEQLSREAGVKVQSMPLYSDALGGPANSYVNLIRHNVTQLVRAMR